MRRRKSVRVVSMLQVGLAGVLILLLVLLAAWYGEKLNTFRPGEDTFQYVAGRKVDFSADASYRNKDGVIEVRDERGDHTLNGAVPILYQGEQKMLLPANMILMTPAQSNGLRRVNYFTTVKVEGNIAVFEKDRKSAQSYGGFLYNGEDTYVFLEKTKLRIGTKKVELEPLSYVRAVYKQYVEYYSSADGVHEWIGMSETDVEATLQSGSKIDAGRDVIDSGEGEALLFRTVDKLDVIKMD